MERKNILQIKQEDGSWKHNLAYLGLLLAVSLATVIYLADTKAIFAFSDWSFHASRLEELYLNLKSGSF